jgi:hypothetical protein
VTMTTIMTMIVAMMMEMEMEEAAVHLQVAEERSHLQVN